MGELQEHFVNMCAPLTGNCDGECNGSDQVVWFAGEHTSADYFGYAHGAWTSGTSVGKEVAECLRGKCAIKRVFEKIKSCSQVGL